MNACHEELLEIMRELPAANSATNYLMSWPYIYDPQWEPIYDEMARICQSVPVFWYHKDSSLIGREAARAIRLGLPLVVTASIPAPEGDCCLKDEERRIEAQWIKFRKIVMGAHISVVYLDAEQAPYTKEHPRSVEEVAHDETIHNYNTLIYEMAKRHTPPNTPVLRHGHLAVYRKGLPTRMNPWTNPQDVADVGWSAGLYWMDTPTKWMDHLKLTMEYGEMHGIREGTIAISPGISYKETPGIDIPQPYELKGTGTYSTPYAVRTSYNYGAFLAGGGPWQFRGIDPNMVKGVFFWPGIMHKDALKTQLVHTVGFLTGLLTHNAHDVRLDRIQKELWLDEDEESSDSSPSISVASGGG